MTREEAISRQAVLEMAYDMSEIDGEHFTKPWMVVDVEDIQKLPSVKPQEPVLDKIRAEIEARLCDVVSDYTDGYRTAIQGVLAIFDKYKAESEPQERNDKE